jgi:hypothetical protein
LKCNLGLFGLLEKGEKCVFIECFLWPEACREVILALLLETLKCLKWAGLA